MKDVEKFKELNKFKKLLNDSYLAIIEYRFDDFYDLEKLIKMYQED